MNPSDIALVVVTAYVVLVWLDVVVMGTGVTRRAVEAVSRTLCRSFRTCDADDKVGVLVALSLGASAFYIALALQLGY